MNQQTPDILNCDVEVIHEDVVREVRALLPPAHDFLAIAALYKALCDPTRVKILWALSRREMCVCDLAALCNMSNSAISHQLKTLRLSNLVKFHKQGKVVYYSLFDDHVRVLFEQGFEHIRHRR